MYRNIALGDWQSLPEEISSVSRVPDLRDFSFWRSLIDEGNYPYDLAQVHIYYWGVLMNSTPQELSDIKTGVDTGLSILNNDILPNLSTLISKLKKSEEFDAGKWLLNIGTALISIGTGTISVGIVSVTNTIVELQRQGKVAEARQQAEGLLGRYRQLQEIYSGLKPIVDFFYVKGLMLRNYYLKYMRREPDMFYTKIINSLYHNEMNDADAKRLISDAGAGRGITPDSRDVFPLGEIDTASVMPGSGFTTAAMVAAGGLVAILI